MSIIQVLNEIKGEDVVLPAIQRDFVWPEEKVYKLLDSIMRGYPIGVVLMWETYDDIQFRHFDREYLPSNKHSFHGNRRKKRLKVVLDGQQRLQSLYIALYGQHEGRYLYFDVLSGQNPDDFSEIRYIFRFAIPGDIENVNALTDDTSPREESENAEEYQYFVKVQDIYEMSSSTRQTFSRKLEKNLKLSEEDSIRLATNLGKIDDVLVKDENILKTVTIDENKPGGNPERKNESDILELFVRINTLGTQLNRSDLIFSMLKLNWRESAEAFPEFIESVNKGNSFEIDNDLVIRCLFAVSNLGTKFNVDVLRKKSNVVTIKQNFNKCCSAIRSTVDAIQEHCWCANSRVLGGHNTLVPFVYYLFHTKKHELPNTEIDSFRKALYLFGFATPFSRYGDSRLWRFIHNELKPLAEKGDTTFPLADAVAWVEYWEHHDQFGSKLLQENPKLALYVVQENRGARAQHPSNIPQMDHIFPRSILKKKNYDLTLVNHYANFWLLSKGKNQNKSNIDPSKYFADVQKAQLKRAIIDRDMLKYSLYKKFIKVRGEAILEKVKKKLGFRDSDFAFLHEADADD